jgi:hypothetical protein
MAASFKFTFPVFHFKASSGWVKDFRKNSRIRQVTKYVSSRKDNTTFEETVDCNEMFQKQLQQF